jgi:hypothetical protein
MTSDHLEEAESGEEDDYTSDELLEQAQINAQALFLGTAATFDGDGTRLDLWRDRLAATFAKGWDIEAEWDAADILYALLTSYRSYGALIVDADLEAEEPVAVITNLPNQFLAEALGVDHRLLHHLFRIGEQLARVLGGTLTWSETPDGDIELRTSTA